jgi:excisionase family DNA binding protein
MLTTKEAARQLGFKTTGAVRQLILAGRLTAEKRGRDWFVSAEEIARFALLRRPVGRPAASRAGAGETTCEK